MATTEARWATRYLPQVKHITGLLQQTNSGRYILAARRAIVFSGLPDRTGPGQQAFRAGLISRIDWPRPDRSLSWPAALTTQEWGPARRGTCMVDFGRGDSADFLRQSLKLNQFILNGSVLSNPDDFPSLSCVVGWIEIKTKLPCRQNRTEEIRWSGHCGRGELECGRPARLALAFPFFGFQSSLTSSSLSGTDGRRRVDRSSIRCPGDTQCLE